MPLLFSYDIKNPYLFLGPCAILIGYLLYTMFRKRKGERPGQEGREPVL
jgi:hypothetical protein